MVAEENAIFRLRNSGSAIQRVVLKLACFAILLFIGCSSAPKILPKNEINEPVFHKTHYSGIGGDLGEALTKIDGDGNYPMSIYFKPTFYFERNVNNWASYTLLPVFWNFLLTGEQYADSSNLRLRKMSLALHGGISGIYYSQRTGWGTSGLLSITGKYLLDEHMFANSELKLDIYDLSRPGNSINLFFIGLGYQISRRNSVKLDYSLANFNIPNNSQYNDARIIYTNKDSKSEIVLRHSFYAKSKHIFGPEAGFNYKNYGVLKNNHIKFGAHYTFLFN